MRINIDDDNENWRKWGELVKSWVDQPNTRPADTPELAAQMAQNGINGDIPGPGRPVDFVDYGDDGPLMISLPSQQMLKEKLDPLSYGPYPLLPGFYAVAFGGAAKATLTAQETFAFALRRIGEYTINECC
jgi:hypothetical protein